MRKMSETLVVLPDPERVIEGLRDTGYQFDSAIADIVDNSLAAEATDVLIDIEMEYDGKICVYIVDNGIGMNRDELINGMRYGSQTRKSHLSLGKFGLGLKTASTAFCRKLSVISRDNDSGYLKATWDLDHVAKTGTWELLLDTPTKEEIDRIQKAAGDGSGTLVKWENVDRLIKIYQEPTGRYATNAFDNKIKELQDKLPIIFQRFLDPSDNRAPKVNITLNGDPLTPWNPFYPTDSDIIGPETREVETFDGTISNFTVTAYILPRRDDFASKELASKARISNVYQGIYVYRENRLIYGPGWFNIYSKEPHFSLLRIEFSFDHTLDDAFHIDIKKSQVLLNEELRRWLARTFLPAPRRAAEDKYRKGQKKKISKMSENIHRSSNMNIATQAPSVSESQVKVVNKQTEEVQVTNKDGTSLIRIKLSEPESPDEIHVKPVKSIEDGLLWEPSVMNNNVAVCINTGHEYYAKVYVPNQDSSVVIQGLDSLLWALTEAEMETINEQNQRYFIELRYAVSKILRTLVKDMPDPVIED